MSKTVEDVYFDKKAAEKEVAKMVKALISDAEIYEQVKEHVIKAMDSACAFYRPIKRPRKKENDIIEK